MRTCSKILNILTVDEGEKQTGIDFFYNLPECIEAEVESESKLESW